MCLIGERSSSSSSSRASPSRLYTSRKATSIEDGAATSRLRETQSETREGNNNGAYTNGNGAAAARRATAAYAPSAPASASKYGVATRSRYGDVATSTRSYQPTFRSRFLRSSLETTPTSRDAAAAADDDADARPSVADLRRRYDHNRNDVATSMERDPPVGSCSLPQLWHLIGRLAGQSGANPDWLLGSQQVQTCSLPHFLCDIKIKRCCSWLIGNPSAAEPIGGP